MAALLLARGDAPAAAPQPRAAAAPTWQGTGRISAAALDLLVDAHLAAGRPRRRPERPPSGSADARVRGGPPTAARRWPRRRRGAWRRPRGDDAAAAEQLEAARAAWARLELPFEAGPHARSTSPGCSPTASPTLAIDHARRALASFEELGAALDADRVAAFLRSLGVTARTGAKGVGTLTGREQEVLRLLGRRAVEPRDRRAAAHQPQDRRHTTSAAS